MSEKIPKPLSESFPKKIEVEGFIEKFGLQDLKTGDLLDVVTNDRDFFNAQEFKGFMQLAPERFGEYRFWGIKLINTQKHWSEDKVNKGEKLIALSDIEDIKKSKVDK